MLWTSPSVTHPPLVFLRPSLFASRLLPAQPAAPHSVSAFPCILASVPESRCLSKSFLNFSFPSLHSGFQITFHTFPSLPTPKAQGRRGSLSHLSCAPHVGPGAWPCCLGRLKRMPFPSYLLFLSVFFNLFPDIFKFLFLPKNKTKQTKRSKNKPKKQTIKKQKTLNNHQNPNIYFSSM